MNRVTHMFLHACCAVCLVVVCGVGCGKREAPDTGKKTRTSSAKGKGVQVTKSDTKSSEKSPASKAVKPVEIDVSFTKAQREAAEKMESLLHNGLFPLKERSKKKNALIFLYLAAQGKNEKVVAAALQAMGKSWTHSTRNEKRMLVNGAYKKVVRTRLSSKRKNILGRALEAVPPAIAGKEPDKNMIKILVRTLEKNTDASVRFGVIEAVSHVRLFQKDKSIAKALRKTLDDKEAFVVSQALFRLRTSSQQLVLRDSFFQKTKELLGHQDPGVRGRATVFVARLAKEDEKQSLVALLEPLLQDKHAFVRSSAATALAQLGSLKSAHAMMALLDDSTRNTYAIPFTQITGEKRKVHHDGSAWSRVDDAVLYALKTLTVPLKEKKFVYRKVEYKTEKKDIAEAIKDARKWYKRHKKSLPPR